jgi:hypothetical protein
MVFLGDSGSNLGPKTFCPEIFLYFPQCFKANIGIEPQVSPQRVPSTSLPIHYLLIIRLYVIQATKSVVTLTRGYTNLLAILHLIILLHLYILYTHLFSHQCNSSLKIKKFHSSTSRHVSAAKGHHQVSCYATTVALYKI